MKCPHCLNAIHVSWDEVYMDEYKGGMWWVVYARCPACERIIVKLRNRGGPHAPENDALVYPRGSGRTPLSDTVPEAFASDYREACLVLTDSAKASAALSRRCLQALLRETTDVTHGNLANEIQQVLDSGKLPSDLSEAIDGVRNLGNFGAHPIKSQHSGEIIEVEEGEAEWLLDTVEGLFDFFFVRPAAMATKRNALNAKLKEAGKPEMKTGPAEN